MKLSGLNGGSTLYVFTSIHEVSKVAVSKTSMSQSELRFHLILVSYKFSQRNLTQTSISVPCSTGREREGVPHCYIGRII